MEVLSYRPGEVITHPSGEQIGVCADVWNGEAVIAWRTEEGEPLDKLLRHAEKIRRLKSFRNVKVRRLTSDSGIGYDEAKDQPAEQSPSGVRSQ